MTMKQQIELGGDEVEEDQQGLDAVDLPQNDAAQPLNPQFNHDWTEKIIEDRPQRLTRRGNEVSDDSGVSIFKKANQVGPNCVKIRYQIANLLGDRKGREIDFFQLYLDNDTMDQMVANSNCAHAVFISNIQDTSSAWKAN